MHPPNTTLSRHNMSLPSEAPLAEIRKWRVEAEKGDSEAQYKLGAAYSKLWDAYWKKGNTEAYWTLVNAERSMEVEEEPDVEEEADAEKEADLDAAEDAIVDRDEAVRWFRAAAEQGHSDALRRLRELAEFVAGAQCTLGVIYAHGTGVPKDAVEAVQWYRKAADGEEATGQFLLGDAYAKGEGLQKDEKEALGWFSFAAMRGHTGALSRLQEIAAQGNRDAQCALGHVYSDGKLEVRHWGKAIEWYQRAAEGGDTVALNYLEDLRLWFPAAGFALGVMYSEGKGVSVDKERSLSYFSLAGARGHTEAEYNAGVIEWDAGDKAQAIRRFGSAAKQGHSDARRRLHEMADTGDAASQWELGYLYADGLGQSKDEVTAVEWYRKAAEQGHILAQCSLGFMYAKGKGVSKDGVEAANWYRRAAEQGFAAGQIFLGDRYAEGDGVPKDEAQAYKWYLLAGSQGNEAAKERYTVLERNLTPGQREEGQRMARESFPRS